jgi:hypothetical protein
VDPSPLAPLALAATRKVTSPAWPGQSTRIHRVKCVCGEWVDVELRLARNCCGASASYSAPAPRRFKQPRHTSK